MRREFEHYLDNLEAARALIKPCYPNDLGKNALIQSVRENAKKQAALGHHRYFDESAGYPDYYERTNDLTQVIIDILTVADSLDAATDNIGRCYANGISFSQLVQQLFDGSGTRYAPYVTDLFRNPDFYRYLEKHLPGWRQDAYYEAYLSSGTEDTLTF